MKERYVVVVEAKVRMPIQITLYEGDEMGDVEYVEKKARTYFADQMGSIEYKDVEIERFDFDEYVKRYGRL